MKKLKTNNKGITLIALVVTIVVLLILAAVSISMLTGENGIIRQAQNSKEQNEIGEEKEYINLAFSAVKAGKISIGDTSDVTSAELQQEINKYTNGATVTGTGILKITYTSGREYEVDGSGKILNNSSYDGMYSVGGLEGKIAPEDLFEYEIIDEQAKTARILKIKPEYCNKGGYNPNYNIWNLTDTNGDIIYNGEKISDMLVIPYEMEQNGKKYTITEANIGVIEYSNQSTFDMVFNEYLPNVNWIIYPNSVEVIELYWSEYGEWSYAYFNGISEVQKVTLPNKLKRIGESAFNNCVNLQEIELPDTVTSIGKDAFLNTAWLNNQPDGDVYIGNVYLQYKGNMESNTNIEIREGTTAIADSAFDSKINLSSIIIPEGVVNIGKEAFSECRGLTSITLPNSIRSIGEGAFCYANNLADITIPETVIEIGNMAFDGTKWLNDQPDGDLYIGKIYYGYMGQMPENTSITIKEGTTQIVSVGGEELVNITIPSSVTKIGMGAFSGCEKLTNIILPNIKTISSYAFYGCKSLTSIIIPDSVEIIENSAFEGCSGLTNVVMSNNIKSIGYYAFSIGYYGFVTELTTITLPDTLKSVGYAAFYDISTVNYRGTEEQWQKIYFATDDFYNSTIVFNYTGE